MQYPPVVAGQYRLFNHGKHTALRVLGSCWALKLGPTASSRMALVNVSEWITQGRSQGAGAAPGTRFGMASGSLQAKGGRHACPRPRQRLNGVLVLALHGLLSDTCTQSPHTVCSTWSPCGSLLVVCCVAKCRSTTSKLYQAQHHTCSKQNGCVAWIEAGQLASTSGASQPHQPAARPQLSTPVSQTLHRPSPQRRLIFPSSSPSHPQHIS